MQCAHVFIWVGALQTSKASMHTQPVPSSAVPFILPGPPPPPPLSWSQFKPIVVPTDPAEVAKVLGKWNLNKVAWQKNLGQPIDVTWCVL